MNMGKLYCIGVGPGDPELLTLKALRILRDVNCICVPKGREEGSSLALSIVKKVLDLNNKEIIEAYFPMRKTKGQDLCELDTRWNEIVDNILKQLNQGIDVAFITMGDPTIYSTFFYLYDRLLELKADLPVEIIPGVSSITAAASRANIALGLGDERIAILPANYMNDLEKTLELFDTVVLMKVHKAFENILKILIKANLVDKAVYVLRAGLDDEKIFRDIRKVRKEDLNYFSLVVIKK
ncbi:precorrin-2 C(20)-methyltransferase [bacterium]|nr:precorrin-2 C(20)-methyltransferase [bacterium]MBU1614342.1 precorrin-2 C(20)-methyltransferase [bacterium]MBU2634832.1 precorrin-2 C(20)-methyltransferase [Nanoarchaeota archaeon]